MWTEQVVTGKAALRLKGTTIPEGLPGGFEVDRIQEPHTGGPELDVAFGWPLTGLHKW